MIIENIFYLGVPMKKKKRCVNSNCGIHTYIRNTYINENLWPWGIPQDPSSCYRPIAAL